jgi:hypothetical protein
MNIPINPTNRYMLANLPGHDPRTGKPINIPHVFLPARSEWHINHLDGGIYTIRQEHYLLKPAPVELILPDTVTWIDVIGPYDEDD